jgi:adenylate cyclase
MIRKAAGKHKSMSLPVARVVARHGRVVISFTSDKVMAILNAPPLEDPDQAAHAPQAALEVAALAREWAFGGVRLGVRVGVSTGPLAAGSVGGGGRRGYTVYGDAVNLAARPGP